MFWKKTEWSKNPGCFERHLQRRDGNVLFPLERRSVTNKAIEEARERDRLEQENFQKKINALASQLQSSKQMPVDQVSPLLQNIQSLIEDAASIGGEALNKIPNLETVEDSLIQQLNSAIPEGKEILEQAK
jgi:seryl-tRNA synthetase